MRLTLVLIFCFSLLGVAQHSSSSDKYLPNTIILKVKADFRSFCSPSGITHPGIMDVLSKNNINSCTKEFPQHQAPLRAKNGSGLKMADLSLIYRLNFSGLSNPKELGAKLMSTGFFDYAEPFFLHDELYTPNDPNIGTFDHLAMIRAYQAWDHFQGDPNIVIGITDTGIELTHPDLMNSIKYNTNDPIDGIDNDADGYIDNLNGWDTGSNDNNPSVSAASPHGVMVASASSATTDNGVGVASSGFKSKFLPIKVSNDAGSLVGTYQGIVYAADHGCQIINCSWGSADSWSQFGQDVIDYAAINKNALVVCAAGNSQAPNKFYPASFEWALSVGGTEVSDQKYVVSAANGSNYNELVDIMAPGRNIYTLNVSSGTQAGRTGTSFAAPITSGAAATLWSKYPTYTGLQIGEILKATADSIETIPANIPYAGMLGEGRLNMERSVTETGFPGLYFYNITFSGNNQGRMTVGDTVSVFGDIYNFLSTSSAGTKIKITTTSPFVTLVNPEITIGAISNLSNGNLNANPFKMVIGAGIPVSASINFVFIITDGNYNTKYFSSATMNLDYVNVTVNKVGTSVGASGKMGYNTLTTQTNGLGVTYNGSASLLYQYGLVVANDATQVSSVLDGDFETEKDMVVKNPGSLSDFDVYTQYDDDPKAAKLDISVKQKTLAWSAVKLQDFILMEHTIVNNSSNTYSNIHVGMYADWDISPYTSNTATFDASNKIAYTFGGAYYGGIHLLNNDPVHHYAFNNDGSNGSMGIYDNFTETEQFSSLSNGNSRATSDLTDVSQTIGTGPFTIAPGDSIKVVFALVAGTNLSQIQTASLVSDSIYNALTHFDVSLVQSTNPTCFGDCNGSIQIAAANGFAPYTYAWDDALSQNTSTALNLCAGTYTCKVTDSIGNIQTIVVSISNPAKLNVSLGMDTTLCSGASKTLNAGSGFVSYLWSNGSSVQTINVSSANSYSVLVTNGIGCVGKDTIEIYTNTAPTVDLGSDKNSCAGSPITLDAGNPGLNFLWSSGASTQSISASTSGTYWVRVTNFGGCSDRDTIVVTVGSVPIVNLGADLGGCSGFQAILNAGNPGSSFLWSTGSTGQSITAKTTANYWVQVTNASGCKGSDTVLFSIETPPIVNLGKDTSICSSSSIVLDAGNPGKNYLWSDASKAQTINVTKAGIYHVKVGNYCFASDTITLNSLSAPLVSYKSGFNTIYNTNKGDVVLDFGLPKGGTYSGTAVTNGVFNTIAAGDGLHKITYSYTGVNGCVGTVWLNLDVNIVNSVIDQELSELSVFPNPFSDIINIRFSNQNLDSEHVSYTLFDAQGKLLAQGLIIAQDLEVNYSIQTEGLVTGIYHLVLQNSSFKSNYKLVKH